MRSGWNEVRSIAEEQWGLVTKRQIEKTGIAWSTVSRQVGIGGLERVAHGVYRLRGGAEPEHLALRAAWLQLAPEAAVWERRPRARTALRRIFMASDTWQPIPTSSLFHAGSRHVARTSGCTGEMLAIVGFNYVDCQ